MNQITMQLPPGYTSLTALDRHKHAGLAVLPNRNYAWCGKLNSVFLNAVELSKASADYPIAFVRETNSGEYLPVALLGLRTGDNVFVDDKGQWRVRTYLPVYVRRYPFCIAEVPAPDGGDPQRLICVQEDQLGPSAKPYFDAKGEPTEDWTTAKNLIESSESARQQTRAFTRRLEAFGLFEPFDALALPQGGGQQMRLLGLHRVNEEKLNALGAREQKLLMNKGEMRAVYAHLLSLENFARLLDMTAELDGRRNPAN
ncbi:MAG: hypothetical protein JWR07_58 [Nevskia sp.]|nr:hypothetical protein [Nevskia sp.]